MILLFDRIVYCSLYTLFVSFFSSSFLITRKVEIGYLSAINTHIKKVVKCISEIMHSCLKFKLFFKFKYYASNHFLLMQAFSVFFIHICIFTFALKYCQCFILLKFINFATYILCKMYS